MVSQALAVLPLIADLVAGAGGPTPEPIVDGIVAQTCQWPSAVALGDDWRMWCTGTLIHPRIVLTAAHCLGDQFPRHAGFGETYTEDLPPQDQLRLAGIELCRPHPQYDPETNAFDLAFCELADPVEDVPIVPLVAGCETDALSSGTEVTIVGFGGEGTFFSETFNDWLTEGIGIKRLARQRISHVDKHEKKVFLLPTQQRQSACHGDSGGPAFVQLPDGTWRVFGAASHLYDPVNPHEPEVGPDGNACGAGVAYADASAIVDWLESNTGFDLTPCWDGDTWVDGPECVAAPLNPHIGRGTWESACGDSLVGSDEPTCFAPGDTDGDSSSTSGGSTSGASSTGAGTSTTGAVMAGTEGTTGSPGGSTSTSAAEPSGGSDGGCACAASPTTNRWGFALIPLLAIFGRRRPRLA